MSTSVLMQKEGLGQMNVPSEKVDAYKLDGWVVIERPIQPAPIIEAQPIDPQVKSPASYFGTPEKPKPESEAESEDAGKTGKRPTKRG